jgi:hypothetical protein
MQLPTSRNQALDSTAAESVTAASEDGFWLDGDDTLSQYDLAPTVRTLARTRTHAIAMMLT